MKLAMAVVQAFVFGAACFLLGALLSDLNFEPVTVVCREADQVDGFSIRFLYRKRFFFNNSKHPMKVVVPMVPVKNQEPKEMQ
jgi:hypothetical protein